MVVLSPPALSEVTDWQAVSARIKARREALGLTQEALGTKVRSSANYVAQVEGGLPISEKKLGVYAEALGLSVPFLRYGVAEAIDLAALREAAREEGRREVLSELQAWLGKHREVGALDPRITTGEMVAMTDGNTLVPVDRPGSATTPLAPPPPALVPGPSDRGGPTGQG